MKHVAGLNLRLEGPPPADLPESVRRDLMRDNRALMVRRARFGMWMLLGFNVLYALADARLAPTHLLALYSLKAVQVGIVASALLFLRPSREQPHVALVSVVVTSSVYVLVAIQATIIHDQLTIPIVCLLVGLATAAVMPWGVGAQVWTMLVATACVTGNAAWLMAGGHTAFGYQHTAVAGALIAAVLLAARFEADRLALWRASWALRESESKYRDLIENLNDVIYAVDETGRLTYLSPAVESLTGYSVEEVLGRNQFEFIHADDVPQMIELFQNGLAGHPVPSECRINTKRGDIRWIRADAKLVRDERGRPGLRGIITDITERRQAEATLRESEERFRELVETIMGMVYTIEPNGQVLYASPQVADYGYRPEEIVGTNMAAYMHPDDVAPVAQSLFDAVTGHPGAIEFRMRRKSGEYRWFRTFGIAVVRGNGQTVINGTMTDITDQKRAEEERAALLAVAQDASGTLDLDRILERVHQRLRELIPCDVAMTFRWDPEQKRHRPIAEHGSRSRHDELMRLEFAGDLPIAERLARGTLVVNDVTDQLWLPVALLNNFGVGAFIATPLEVRSGRLLGASFIFNRLDRPSPTRRCGSSRGSRGSCRSPWKPPSCTASRRTTPTSPARCPASARRSSPARARRTCPIASAAPAPRCWSATSATSTSSKRPSRRFSPPPPSG
jgi:PAS domain S-box-containing protein